MCYITPTSPKKNPVYPVSLFLSSRFSLFSPSLVLSLLSFLALSRPLACFSPRSLAALSCTSLVAMPLPSKIIRSAFGDDDLLLGPGHQDTRTSPLSGPVLPDTDAFPGYHPNTSFYPDDVPDFYDRDSRASAPLAGSIGNGHSARSVSNPRSTSSQSHISISSSTPRILGADAEVILLRQENATLKQQIQRLRGQVDGVTCVICQSYLIIFILIIVLSETRTVASFITLATRSTKPGRMSRR